MRRNYLPAHAGAAVLLLLAGTGSCAAAAYGKDNAGNSGNAVAVASPLILQIRVVEGEGATYAAGSRAIKGITVEITDEAGQPVQGAAVSFRLPEEGASGLFQNGTRTEIASTARTGRATIWGMKWNRTTGALVVRITAAKGETRAGALVRQVLVEPAVAAAAAGPSVQQQGPPRIRVRSGKRWVWISAIAAAAAGAGLALGARSGQSSSGSSGAAAGSGIVIGNPVIIVGK